MAGLGDHELWCALTKLDPNSLVAAAGACRAWQRLADEDALWRWQCAAMWAGKSYVPSRFLEPGLPRKEAYFAALRDSRRTELMSEELSAFTWERCWTGMGNPREGELEADPRKLVGDIVEFTETRRLEVQGDLRRYPCLMGRLDEDSDSTSDGDDAMEDIAAPVAQESATTVYCGRMRVLRAGASGLGSGPMRWCMLARQDATGANVSFVANGPDAPGEDDDFFGSFYPPKMVRRTPLWGWAMQNDWATYSLIGTTVAFRNELEATLSKVPTLDPAPPPNQ